MIILLLAAYKDIHRRLQKRMRRSLDLLRAHVCLRRIQSHHPKSRKRSMAYPCKQATPNFRLPLLRSTQHQRNITDENAVAFDDGHPVAYKNHGIFEVIHLKVHLFLVRYVSIHPVKTVAHVCSHSLARSFVQSSFPDSQRI